MFVWKRNTNSVDLTWKKGTYTTDDFSFIHKKDFIKGKDIAIKQAISKEMINPIKGKCYYIRPTDGMYHAVINTLSNINFKGYSAVNGGVIALSQEEIVKNYLHGDLR
jgi:hypothetical protein